MNKLKTVISFEFLGFVKKKKNWGPLIFTLVLGVLLILLPHITNLLSGSEEEDNNYYIYFEQVNAPVVDMQGVVGIYSEEELKKILKDKEVEEFYIVGEEGITCYTTKNATIYDSSSAFSNLLKSIYLSDLLDGAGILEEYTELESYVENVETKQITLTDGEYTVIDKENENIYIKYIIGYVLLMIMHISISLFSSYAATSVANEKTSRTMESLIYIADPSVLILGKVLGVFFASIIQVIMVCIVLVGSLYATLTFAPNDLGELMFLVNEIFASISLSYILFFIISYSLAFLTTLFLLASLAATITKIEELPSAITTGTFIMMISFFIAVFIFVGNENTLTNVLSYVPVFTPMAMFARYSMGYTTAFDVVYAIVVPSITVAVIAIFAARLYKVGVLFYGTKPSTKQLIKSILKK